MALYLASFAVLAVIGLMLFAISHWRGVPLGRGCARLATNGTRCGDGGCELCADRNSSDAR